MHQQFFLLKIDSKIKRINLNDLHCVSVSDKITTFILRDKRIICHTSLKAIEDKLPDYFIKLSRHLLINGYKVIELDIKKRIVVLDNQERYSIATRRINVLKKALTTINFALTA